MKHKVWLIFFVSAGVLLRAPLFAQSEEETINASRIANVKVWVDPVSGGTAAEREYFDFNMPEEVRGSGYQLADSRASSDFYILFNLEHDEEYGDEVITAELYATATDSLIISNSMAYTAVDDMADWNLTVIYQLMANAPLHKYITTLEREVEIPPPVRVLGFPEYRLYVGFRGGYSVRRYLLIGDKALRIEKGLSPPGHSFEAGIQVSFQILRFLAVQGELLFTGDAVPFSYYDSNELDLVKTADTYESYSMMIPLTFKGTFHLYDRLVLNPFAGMYFVMPLGRITGVDREGTPIESDFTYNPPLGLTAGLEIGAVLGKERNRGTIFMDIRYSADLGELKRPDTLYQRAAMVSITAGYRFGLFKRNRQARIKEDLPQDFD